MPPTPPLLHHIRNTLVVFILTFCTFSLLGVIAMATGLPFLFPSLGPTGFLLFYDPQSQTSAPKNVLCGHVVGIVCGYFSLWATGLIHAGSVLANGIDPSRIVAAALSFSLTSLLMTILGVHHAPAVATTLIISLGFMTVIRDLVVIEISVGLLVIFALMLQRVPTMIDRPGNQN